MASLDDILTTQKNGVVALSNYTQTMLREQGTLTSSTVTGNTVVVSGAGRLVNYVTVVGGSAVGGIYNSANAASLSSTAQLCATSTTVGVYPVGVMFTAGLTVVPGTGQSVNVTYWKA